MERYFIFLAFLILNGCSVPVRPEPFEIGTTKDYLAGRSLPKPIPAPVAKSQRQQLYDWAQSKVGQRETHGKNRSPFIDSLNRAAKVPMGSPYCGSFVGFGNAKFGFDIPKGYAWSPTWAANERAVRVPDTMDVFTLFYPKLKRVGHVGFHVHTKGAHIETIESNTNDALSREGDGVYAKRRKKASIHRFTRWN